MELVFCVNNYKKFDMSLSMMIAVVILALVQNWSTGTVCGFSAALGEIKALLCHE
jgi:hypothetical protein